MTQKCYISTDIITIYIVFKYFIIQLNLLDVFHAFYE